MQCEKFDELKREKALADAAVVKFGAGSAEGKTYMAQGAELRNQIEAHKKSCEDCIAEQSNHVIQMPQVRTSQ